MRNHVQLYGPGLHRASHILNKVIQDEELKNLLFFFAWLIGCNDPCRRHYIHQIQTDTKYDEQWTYRAHNAINERQGKYHPTWEEVQHVHMRDSMHIMESGVWLFLLYYSKLFHSEVCIEMFKSFFPMFLNEAPPAWTLYYKTHPIVDDFYTWMEDFYDSVNILQLGISLKDVHVFDA